MAQTSPSLRPRRPSSSGRPARGNAAANTRASARSEELRSDFYAIGFALLGALLALGLYRPGSAGAVGTFLVHFFRLWMGQVAYVAPILFFSIALGLALDYRRATNPQMVWGISGFMTMLFGWVHLMVTLPGQTMHTTGVRFAAIAGKKVAEDVLTTPDGGFLGGAVMTLMIPLGRTGSFITLGAIGLASLLLITELTLRGIAERIHERSRIARERARKSARAVKDRCQEAAAALPARRPGRRQSLFLDVGAEEEEAEEAEVRPEPKRGLRRITRTPPVDEPEEVVETRPARSAQKELALPPVTDPAPEPVLDLDIEAEPAPAAVKSPSKVRQPDRPRRNAGGAGGVSGDFQLPPLTLLDAPVARPKVRAQDTEANIAILENTLAQFRIEATVVEIADGPSVTRYEIRLGEGIRVKKILDLADNIAMSLAAMSVRVEAPIPGKAAIGIEVPKKVACVVTLRECLESAEAKDLKTKVGFVLGKDVGGEVRCADLARMPHLLVAGATNSGKSVCLNVLIASMLFRARPDELKMIMIDPKRVELTLYEGIPHLVHPVVKDVKQAAGILRWVLKEMDRRYDLFAQVMTRNIEGYNQKVGEDPERRLPFLVVVIDELADLMMQQGPEVEQSICRLAQLARATGIHLVIATQRPSVDVITGLIKANVPSRISFAVTSQVDSRTILDAKGAESLVGRGDMLFKPVDAIKPVRIQGAFLREGEVEDLVNHLKKQGRPDYIAEALSVDHGAYGHASEEESEDEMFEPAARFVVTTGHASTSMIQRKFKLGYTRAARLVDMMESRGIVGPLDGAKPREIRMNRDQLDQMFNNVRNSLYGGTDYGPSDQGEADVEDDDGPAARDPFIDD